MGGWGWWDGGGGTGEGGGMLTLHLVFYKTRAVGIALWREEKKRKENVVEGTGRNFPFLEEGKPHRSARFLACISVPGPSPAKQLELQMLLLVASLGWLTLWLYSERGMAM